MPISRREFCGAVAASLAVTNTSLFADDSKPESLRVIAYNIFKLTGWPHQRRLAQQAVAKGQMAKRLAMELSLHKPDIINFSEYTQRRTDQGSRRVAGNEPRQISQWRQLAGQHC